MLNSALCVAQGASSKRAGVRGPAVSVCASRKSSLCRTGLGKVVPASSCSMRKQHPLLLACLSPEHLFSYRNSSASREKFRKSPSASQNTAACGWLVCQTVWSCQNTAVGKGDARQHLPAADNSNKNRSWLCAEKILTAAVPSKYFG